MFRFIITPNLLGYEHVFLTILKHKNLQTMTREEIDKIIADAEHEMQGFNRTSKGVSEKLINALKQVKNIAYEPVLPAVYITLDLESSGEDVIWDVSSTEELAKVAENNLKKQRVGGALTKIVYERID